MTPIPADASPAADPSDGIATLTLKVPGDPRAWADSYPEHLHKAAFDDEIEKYTNRDSVRQFFDFIERRDWGSDSATAAGEKVPS